MISSFGREAMQGRQASLNQQEKLKYICKELPYEVQSSMEIRYAGETTFTKLINQSGGYQLLRQLKKANYSKLMDPVYLFTGNIQPENVQWEFFHHIDEINTFLQNISHEIKMMNQYQSRLCGTGNQITRFYEQIKGKKERLDKGELNSFMEFLNLVVNHPFLKKSVRALTFVQHCMPMSLWNLKVFQQIELYKKKNFITKIFSDTQQVDFYLTVTSDGILISTKNLLQTKIDKMILFTNQFEFQTKIDSSKHMIFQLSSCLHEALVVDVEENYLAGINFFLGLKQAMKESDLLEPHRFQSFSKARQNCEAKLYNDGIYYFEDLCDQLRKARHQVCITDWWMTPYFLLKRPDNIENPKNRLDGVLKELSERGVTIFIILFRQPLNMLCNDSEDAQFYLQSLGRNIRVRRHPIVPQLWSHHEKSVIIDQRVGFMGGLDICYGRWDTPEHSLTNKNDNWNGADYTNQRLRSFVPGTTKNILTSPADRQTEPRMPWHDIGIQIRGDSVIDLIRHFIQYWYFVDNQKVKDPYSHFTAIKKRYSRAASYEEPDWEDKGDQEKKSTISESLSLCGKRTQMFIVGSERRLPELLVQVRSGMNEGQKKLQICRSASPWSIGAKNVEDSIHKAYQQLIMQSQRFIYIENQFFMGKKNKIVECLANRIRRAHNNRQNFKVVVVMPLLPGFEGDINDKNNSGPLRIQVHNQFQAINRGQHSLYNKLKDLKNFNIDNYIYFFGLRGHAVINKRPVTEIIYVHSKLMIVDDKRAIIGSANINDRSLLGSRDSQLAVVIEEDNGIGLSDGYPRKKNIFDFRCQIFNEHFGLTKDETFRINESRVWAKIIANAKNNALIYRRIFGCYPDNTMTTGIQVQQRAFEAFPSEYYELSPKIVAHAVEIPLDFMKDDDLEFRFGDKEGLAGEETFL